MGEGAGRRGRERGQAEGSLKMFCSLIKEVNEEIHLCRISFSEEMSQVLTLFKHSSLVCVGLSL